MLPDYQMTPAARPGLADLLSLLREVDGRLDAARELPAEIATALRESGLTALCLPRSLGGGGQPVTTLVEVVEQVARVDAGTAWALFILGTSPWLASRAGDGLGRRIYDDPRRLVAGVLAPTGTAEPAGEHVRLSGRWAFASGCAASDVVLLMARAGTEGTRLFPVPREAVTIAAAWDGLGLGTSGSATISVDNVLIARADQIDLSAPPAWPEPSFAMPFKATFACAAVILLALAREALGYLIGLARV
jgi:alkylation response protein AidB-like acyl-CoA dehydrogenase